MLFEPFHKGNYIKVNITNPNVDVPKVVEQLQESEGYVLSRVVKATAEKRIDIDTSVDDNTMINRYVDFMNTDLDKAK